LIHKYLQAVFEIKNRMGFRAIFLFPPVFIFQYQSITESKTYAIFAFNINNNMTDSLLSGKT